MELYQWAATIIISIFVGACSIFALKEMQPEADKAFLTGANITFVILVGIGLYN